MSRGILVLAAFAACMVVAPLARGQASYRVYDDFESYPLDLPAGSPYYGNAIGWSFFTDTTLGVPQTYVPNVANIPAVPTHAAFFELTSTNLTPGDWVYFETRAYGVPAATSFSASVSVQVNPVLTGAPANAGNPTLVDDLYYYFYTEDAYYETALGAPSDGLVGYGALSLTSAEGSTWTKYDTSNPGGITVSPGVNMLASGDLVTVGLGFQTDATFDTLTELSYMTIWVDNMFAPVPEPSGLLLACFGALGILARRGRRRDA